MSWTFYTDRCDHMWGAPPDEYSKLRYAVEGEDHRVGKISVGICDQCGAIELRIHATGTVVHIREDEYAADHAGRERHLFVNANPLFKMNHEEMRASIEARQQGREAQPTTKDN